MEPFSIIQIQNFYYLLLALLLVCRTCHAKPQPEPSLDINKLIDPLQQPDAADELGDSNRRIKSVFNVPVLATTMAPRCPPGTQRTSPNSDECTAIAPKVSTDDVFLFKAIKNYYAGGGKQPSPPTPPKPPRRRVRTTTTTTAKPDPELPPPYEHSESESSSSSSRSPPIRPATSNHVPPVIYEDFTTTESEMVATNTPVPLRPSKFPPSVFQFGIPPRQESRKSTTKAAVVVAPTTTERMETTPEIIYEETTLPTTTTGPMGFSQFEQKAEHQDNFQEIKILSPAEKVDSSSQSKFQRDEIDLEKEFREAWTMHFELEKTTIYPGIIYDHIEMESVTMGAEEK